MERQTFRKKKNTGMHVVRNFKEGTKVNGQPVQGRAVLRPGNTVYCYPSELGVDGLKQFDALTSNGPVDAEEQKIKQEIIQEESKPVAQLEMVRRGTTAFYDIINSLNPDKPVNAKALRKKDAEKLLVELTQGEVKPINIDELGWDDLVKELEKAGVEWNDDWETEDDLREALRGLNE